MIKRAITSGVVFALGVAALGFGLVQAQGAPTNPPARFAGTVMVNGQPAAAGTVVEARIGGNVCGSTTVFMQNGAANYVVDAFATDAEHPGCGSDGATVTLFVNNQQAGSGSWVNHQLNQVNLVVGAGAATPTATATAGTAVPTPRAPQTGTGSATGGGMEPLVLAGAVILGIAVLGGATVAGSRLGRRRAI
jgi:hypothetical protein